MSESASFQNTHTTFVTPTQNNTFSRGYWIENWILSLGTLLLFDCDDSLWILCSSILSQCGFHLNIAFVCSCFFHQMLLWVSLYQYYQDRRTPADTAEADSVSQLRSLSLYKHKHLPSHTSKCYESLQDVRKGLKPSNNALARIGQQDPIRFWSLLES